MSFFVTSQNPGKGGDLGGLEGADAYCKSLATAAGASADKNWRAYLSTDTENAKDRIGAGPWYNAKGEKIADDVASLHSDGNNITKQTALDETGTVINGRGDTPNRHDILTGSMPDGTAAAGNLRQLDDGRRRRRSDGRASRPHGTGDLADRQIVEPRACLARRLQPGGLQRNRRRRPVLLLRRELIAEQRGGSGQQPAAAYADSYSLNVTHSSSGARSVMRLFSGLVASS